MATSKVLFNVVVQPMSHKTYFLFYTLYNEELRVSRYIGKI